MPPEMFDDMPYSRRRELLNSPSIFERPVTRIRPEYDSATHISPAEHLESMVRLADVMEAHRQRAAAVYDSSIRRFDPNRDAIVWRSTYGFQAHQTRGVVQMSAVDSVASWDGHEPEDL